MNHLYLVKCVETVDCSEVYAVLLCGPNAEWVLRYATSLGRYPRFREDYSNLEMTNLGIADQKIPLGPVLTAHAHC